MTRRAFVAASLASASAYSAQRSRFGVATTCYLTAWKPKDTLEFLEHCNRLGAAGIQASFASLEAAYVKRVGDRAKELGMYIEIMSGLPKASTAQFVQTMEAAKSIGALCVRSACLGGRRYETFATLDDWKKFVADSKTAIARAVPVAEKLKMPFAIENHKDWTVDEMVPLVKSYSSDYFGVCLDTGNNISLLDDPMEVVERLSPYALSTHIKNMAVDEAPEGFLLSEVLADQGMMDMRKVIATIQKARPNTKLTLEMITRNPLNVPCLTDKYWATFPDRNGLPMARTLSMVRAKKTKLPRMEGMDHAAQVQLENENVKQWLAFA